METYDCQDGEMRGATQPMRMLAVLRLRSVEHLRREGFASFVRRASAFAVRRLRRLLRMQAARIPVVAARSQAFAPLRLHAGEWVEVKSREEIESALDSTGRDHGLGFMPQMFSYCGQRLRVYKRAERIILEGTREARRLKNTVLLDGVICHGEGFVCDRSCFYFWKEDWLRRVPPPNGEQPSRDWRAAVTTPATVSSRTMGTAPILCSMTRLMISAARVRRDGDEVVPASALLRDRQGWIPTSRVTSDASASVDDGSDRSDSS